MAGFIRLLIVLALGGLGVAYWVTEPRPLVDLPKHTADVKNGEYQFWVAGCAGCHTEKKAKGEARLLLGGGQAFKTDFGTFYAPNISSDKTVGIGGWSELDVVNAVMRGISPKGQHYYPALPYTSYSRMKVEDVMDLAAFLKTVPPVATPSKPHDVPFPFNIRRAMGGWKFLFMNEKPEINVAPLSPEVKRGAALVEGAGHCGECHTPRNFLGATLYGKWLGGGPNPDGDGRIPNLTPGGRLAKWQPDEIVDYLSTGMSPSGDFVGGSMAEVVENMSHATKEDLAAIAAYLKAVPAVAAPPK